MQFTTNTLPSHVAFEMTDGKIILKAIFRRGDAAKPWTKEGRKTSRVYGALDALVPELMALEPFAGNYGEDFYSIPLPSPERSAEDNVRAAMWQGWKRETLKVGTAKLLEVLAAAFAEQDGLGTPESARFSATAGCTCPCSPGFILPERLTFDGTPIDFWFEVVKPAN